MIRKLVVLDAIEHTFFTPIINTIANDLNREFINDPDLFLNKESMYANENVSLPDNIYDNAIGGSNLDIDYEIVENEDINEVVSSLYRVNRPIIYDKDIKLDIRPVNITTDINIKFKYRGQSKIKMNRIKNRLYNYYQSSSYMIYHESEYSYLLPPILLQLLENINKLKNETSNVINYILKHSKTTIDLAIKRGSDYKIPGVRGNLSRILGRINEEPKEIHIEKEDVPEYGIEFTYTVTVPQPSALLVAYPPIVKNKPLDKHWLPKEYVATGAHNTHRDLGIQEVAYHRLEDTRHFFDLNINVPSYDTFTMPRYVHEAVTNICNILLTVDPKEPNKICDIDDLDLIGLPKIITDYIRSKQGNDLFTLGKSILHLILWDKDRPKYKGMYVKDNTIYTNIPLELDGEYRLSICIINDLSIIVTNDKNEVEEAKVMLRKLNMYYDDDGLLSLTSKDVREL